MTGACLLSAAAAPGQPVPPEPIPPDFEDARLFDIGRCQPNGIAAGDVNNDGLMDLVVTHPTIPGLPPCQPFVQSISVLLNNGNWTAPNVGLTVAQVIELTGCNCRPLRVVLAPMDGDQLPDIVVGDGLGFVHVLINGIPTPGSFGPLPPTSLGSPQFSVDGIVVKDFNGDGLNDVACASLDDNRVLTMAGDGFGGFDAADIDTWFVPNGGTSVRGIDAKRIITPSPGPDIVTTGTTFPGQLGFLRNISTPGNIIFDPQVLPITYIDHSLFFPALRLAKIDGDNHWDILTIRHFSNARLDTYFGDGAGNFEHLERDEYAVKQLHECPAPDPDDAPLPGFDVGRINDPGAVNDVVVISSKGRDFVHIYPGRSDRDLEPERPEAGCPTPTEPPPYNFSIEPANQGQNSAEGPVNVVIVDLDDDGYNDLVTTNNESHNLTILINANPPQ